MVGLVHGEGAYTAIPLPGSATYANEAVIAQLVPPGGKLLIHTNGVYGDRLIEIAAHLGTPHAVIRTAPFTPPTAEQVRTGDRRRPGDHTCDDRALRDQHRRAEPARVALPQSAAATPRVCSSTPSLPSVPSISTPASSAFQAVTVSSNKCMQGVPGIGWAVGAENRAGERAWSRCFAGARPLGPEPAHGPYDGVPLHAADAGGGRVRPGLSRARPGGRHGGAARPLSAQLATAGRRHAADGLRDRGARRVRLADRGDLPQSGPSGVQLSGAVRGHEAARLHHLSRPPRAGQYVPHRLHGRRDRGRTCPRPCRRLPTRWTKWASLNLGVSRPPH